MGKRISLVIVAVLLLSVSPKGAEAFNFSFGAPDWQNTLRNDSRPAAQKLLFWLNVTEGSQKYSTKELIRFIEQNSSWPKLYLFREDIEDQIDSGPADIVAWFDQNPPKSSEGIRKYVGALTRLDHHDKAKVALRKFWTDAELSHKETTSLTAQYKKLLTPADHWARTDNLLWEQRYQEAEYMTPYIGADHAKLAQARINVGRMSSKAAKYVKEVPAGLQNDPGLTFERLKYRRQMNKDQDALALLKHAPKVPSHPELWWRERNILARRALEKHNYAGMYDIISNHGLAPGVDYSQAEWMLGWLSLRFLDKPERALHHFEKFNEAVNSAVSRSRAAYWLGRTSEALNKPAEAKKWYALATQFPSTFYGQLSREKVENPPDVSAFADDEVSEEARAAFEQSELVQAIRMLHDLDADNRTLPFFVKLLDKAKDRGDFVLIAKLGRETGRLYFAVEANKQLQQKLGDFMFTEGYPMLPSLPLKKPEKALVHAIVHRESMFDTQAASSAGARGLMQLMPATAKQVSRGIGKSFTLNKLTENPQYNVELGSSYLQSLIDDYNGFYPLAIAAYNAGPRNVDEWIKKFGDPRKKNADLIDWIEMIPIYETRNYVQRVMESYYMYKLKLSEKPRTVLTFNN